MNNRKRVSIEIDIYLDEAQEEKFRADHGLDAQERLAPRVYEAVMDRLKGMGPWVLAAGYRER